MKGVFIFAVTLAVTSAFVQYDQEWEAFKRKLGKNYTPEEDAKKHQIFMNNKVIIAEHNKRFEEGKETFKMGINQFADSLPEELKQFKGLATNPKERKVGTKINKPLKDAAYPDSVDWRDSGCVSSVYNQGQCGSAWVFSVIGSIESVCCIKNGNFVPLSTQNLEDCILGRTCSGGSTSDGFDYCVENGGIDTESGYPSDEPGTCQFDPTTAACPCAGYVTISSGSEDELLAAVATVGPVSANIDASNLSFQVYTTGIYYEPECSSENLDHSVLVVGYGTDNGEDFWLAKNSWGTSWGESGYIRMSRNRDNNCGIASDATYPLFD